MLQGLCCKAFAASVLLDALLADDPPSTETAWGRAVPGERFELPTNGLQI
jgi:hypothetical protein